MKKHLDSTREEEFDAGDTAVDAYGSGVELPVTDEWTCSEEEVQFICDSVRDTLDD